MVNYSLYAIKNIHTGLFYKTDKFNFSAPVYVKDWHSGTFHYMTESRAKDWLLAVKEIFNMEDNNDMCLVKIKATCQEVRT